MPGSITDRGLKRERIAAVRAAHGGHDVLLTSHEALAWYLEGPRTHVSLAGPPVLAVRASDEGDVLFVAANEADRLIAEELLAEDADRVVRVPWQIPPAVAAADAGLGLAESQIAAELRAARASLLPAETRRYRALGRTTAEALTDAAEQLTPRMTERAAAALVVDQLVSRGLDPLVTLVTGEERVAYRHPLPTDAVLGERAMLVVCARQHGLIANATRWVGGVGADDEPILEVEAAFFAATQPGSALNEVFAAGCAAYGAAGFDESEWRNHHQGGPTGYAGRDPRAMESAADTVVDNHAFAWNPSAPDAKVEDTVLVSSGGIEVLTADPRWPSVVHAGLRRPAARPF